MYKFANTAIEGLENTIECLESNLEELGTLLYCAENAEEKSENEIFELRENILFIEEQKQTFELTLRGLEQFSKESGC